MNNLLYNARGTDTIATNSPFANRGWGPAIWKELFLEAYSALYLTWRLFLRDFNVKYRQTFLGYFWALLLPMVVVGSFVILNRSGVMDIGEVSIPYPAYALVGITIWQLFATGIIAACNSIVTGGRMVVKINFPKESLVFASIGQALVETGIRIVLIAVVFCYYRIVPPWEAVFVPFLVMPLLLLTIGMGLLFSLLNVLFRDTLNIVTISMTFLLFLTPVVYPNNLEGTLAVVMNYNPLFYLVDGPKSMFISGHIGEIKGYVLSSMISIVFFFASWRIFHLVEPKMSEVV